MTTTKPWTINAIQEAMRKEGSHWWDPDTMKCFGTEVLPEVYEGTGGVYFVTKDKDYKGDKAYTVRQFYPDSNGISTMQGLAKWSRRGAVSLAKELAGDDHETTKEQFKAVSVVEQVCHDLRQHGSALPKESDVVKLIHLASMHEKYMVAQCNGTWPYDRTSGDDHPAVVRKCRKELHKLAVNLGAKGVLCGGDPRGCTAKLVFSDGFTNDFAKEGYCIPTSTKGSDDSTRTSTVTRSSTVKGNTSASSPLSPASTTVSPADRSAATTGHPGSFWRSPPPSPESSNQNECRAENGHPLSMGDAALSRPTARR